MKKLLKIGAALLACASLSSCASKCDYATFHEKATAVEEFKYTKAVVNGEIESDDTTFTFDKIKFEYKTVASLLGQEAKTWTTEDSGTAAGLATMYLAMTAATVGEDETCTYYAGSTFKVVFDDEEAKETITFNKYGLLTSMKGSDGENTVNVTIKYSK